jgi:hypothetical protein
MGAPSDRRAHARVAPRIVAVLGAILFAGTWLTACSVTPESAAPTGTPLAEPSLPLAEPSVPLPLPTGSEAPFLVPAFDGPAPQHVKNGTTHVLKNPNPGASAFHTVEYTIPPGWETGDLHIGKKLGQPGEVAISFWTPAGVYADPCRRTTDLSPIDLAVHTHTDRGELILMNYPQIGLSAQDGREATEARSLIIDDPSEDGGTIALRLELTVPEDLDLASCDDGVYVAWPSNHAGDRPNDNHVAGQTDIIYQVDVDLGALVIDGSFRPESTPEDVEELYAVLGSIVMDRY